MANVRNQLTTHPKIRARREGALSRFTVNAVRAERDPAYAQAKAVEHAALVRKLAQRKQGSAK
jgi:hypothetical protein